MDHSFLFKANLIGSSYNTLVHNAVVLQLGSTTIYCFFNFSTIDSYVKITLKNIVELYKEFNMMRLMNVMTLYPIYLNRFLL